MNIKKWPELSYTQAKATYETLHLWAQIVGKIKLKRMPWINHSWHVTLQVTPTGLSTSLVPYDDKHFQIDFDLIRHQLIIACSSGQTMAFPLEGLSVAHFYERVMDGLNEFGIQVKINTTPNEMADPIPLSQDHTHSTYKPEHAAALHQVLLNVQEIFTQFRAQFRGKCSPVHFFWGSFDLAVTRFSGRTASKHPGGMPNLPDWVVQEAYSHEVSSAGFWPGSEAFPNAAFYSYAYPEPDGYKDYKAKPAQAYYHAELREFILPYGAVQKSSDPASAVMDFLQSTYEAAAELAHWDRAALETE